MTIKLLSLSSPEFVVSAFVRAFFLRLFFLHRSAPCHSPNGA